MNCAYTRGVIGLRFCDSTQIFVRFFGFPKILMRFSVPNIPTVCDFVHFCAVFRFFAEFSYVFTVISIGFSVPGTPLSPPWAVLIHTLCPHCPLQWRLMKNDMILPFQQLHVTKKCLVLDNYCNSIFVMFNHVHCLECTCDIVWINTCPLTQYCNKRVILNKSLSLSHSQYKKTTSVQFPWVSIACLKRDTDQLG